MTLLDGALLFAAAFLAGGLNAVAGGGSFLTLPALAFVGVPLVSANATGTAALLPGYVASTWAFRRELGKGSRLPVPTLAWLSVVGGAAGAALLTWTSNEAFRHIVPWLLLVATLLFALGGKLVTRIAAARGAACTPAGNDWTAYAAIFAVAVYGGYFNGGLGILLLATLVLLGEKDLNAMNGAKNLASAILTLIAVALYAASGLVVWGHALAMMLASTLGGYAGGRLARRLPPAAVRAVVVATGVVMTVVFFVRS
jgi:uncharacterized protein